MNPNHQKFINEYLTSGDKTAAYRKAYPKAKESSITNAVNRLMQREDVSSIINKTEERAFKKAEAALEKRIQSNLLDLCEAQQLLTQIARGQHTVQKPVKENGEWTTINAKPTHNSILRAINAYFRLSAGKAPSNSPQGGGQEQPGTIPPPWGEQEGASASAPPHPFGNIYPANYPGPYYDPGDPNTKEKLQNLRFDRLTDFPVTTTTTPVQLTAGNNNNQSRHSDSECFRKEESPESMQLAQPGQQSSTTTPVPLIAVNNNAPSPLGGAGGGLNPENQQQKTTNSPQKSTTRFSPYVEQMLLRDRLRKEGWQTVEEAGNEVYETFIRNQCSQNYKLLKQFEKLRAARNLPPEERGLIEKETGWTYHPQHSFMLKRKR